MIFQLVASMVGKVLIAQNAYQWLDVLMESVQTTLILAIAALDGKELCVTPLFASKFFNVIVFETVRKSVLNVLLTYFFFDRPSCVHGTCMVGLNGTDNFCLCEMGWKSEACNSCVPYWQCPNQVSVCLL